MVSNDRSMNQGRVQWGDGLECCSESALFQLNPTLRWRIISWQLPSGGFSLLNRRSKEQTYRRFISLYCRGIDGLLLACTRSLLSSFILPSLIHRLKCGGNLMLVSAPIPQLFKPYLKSNPPVLQCCCLFLSFCQPKRWFPRATSTLIIHWLLTPNEPLQSD